MLNIWLLDGKYDGESSNAGCHYKLEKKSCFSMIPERMQTQWHLDFNPPRLILYFWLPNDPAINLCYFKLFLLVVICSNSHRKWMQQVCRRQDQWVKLSVHWCNGKTPWIFKMPLAVATKVTKYLRIKMPRMETITVKKTHKTLLRKKWKLKYIDLLCLSSRKLNMDKILLSSKTFYRFYVIQ